MPSLSIVTPIYNSSKTLKPYLEGIFKSHFQDFELIIVDGMSNDLPLTILKDYSLKYEQLNRHCSSAEKRNRGVELARAEVILFLDSDVVILPTVLGDIMNVFSNYPEIAGLIGSYDDAPESKKIISQFKFLFHHYTHQHEADYVDSFWTGCGAIKKSVFNSLGGFNAPFLKGESVFDIEFGYRLKKNNFKIYNAKHILVKHLKDLGFFESIYIDIFLRGMPWVVIMLTYRDLSLKLNTKLNGVLSVLSTWGMLLSLGGLFFNSICIYGMLIFLALFLFLNWELLRFLEFKRNWMFSFLSLFYLFIYYISCGISVFIGVFAYSQNYEKNRLYRTGIIKKLGLKKYS